ncbi:ABC transporter permease [Streptomyces sp. J2-1]|uniref:ABC transporter permease n=1 Tax=Streptomyces corallincola TaxID=2851888 RepID=UPI001C38DD76|nr:ABC transporter permease [Streptomyces corallincola]MBV2357978.1 ABC transporter permease [Streptomyces corallincola]
MTTLDLASSERGERRTSGRVRRLRALARAELTLLLRNRTVVLTALAVPLTLPFCVRPALDRLDLSGRGPGVGAALTTVAVGFSFLFAVHTALVGTYVARREELVLKRLRTGELTDAEILIGTALPAVALGLVQSLLLCAGGAVLLHTGVPRAPGLTVLGVLLGLVLSAALAALTSVVTRSVEGAQVTALPLVLATMIGSGLAVPVESLPARFARGLELLPLSPAVRLVRAGWTGDLGGPELLRTIAVALVWIAVAVFAVRRWFRWEGRR